jgi:ferredoxin
MKQTVKEWLDKGAVDVFLGYKKEKGHCLPHCFVKERLEEVDDLVEGPDRYPLEKTATRLAIAHPELTIGLAARACTSRALNVLSIFNQVPKDRIRLLAQNCCPSPLSRQAHCSHLNAPVPKPYKLKAGIDKTMTERQVAALEPAERLNRWMYEFEKCIKCLGCRDICPVCFCTECSLQNEALVVPGSLPPEVPIFHLTRAVHMAGRCIDCGLCEEACPMDIPLRLLYAKVNRIVQELFDYETGIATDQPPFNSLDPGPPLEPKPMENI